MGVIIIHCMTPWRYVEFMVVPDGRMTLCRPRRRHAGDGLERMRVRYWKANLRQIGRSVARVQEVVLRCAQTDRSNGPLTAAGAAPGPAANWADGSAGFNVVVRRRADRCAVMKATFVVNT